MSPFNITYASDFQNITFGTPTTGSITTSNNENIYRIVVPQAGKLKINMLSQIEAIDVYLEDNTGKEITYDYISVGSKKSPKAWEKSIDLEAGTYYFKITNSYSDPGIYTITANFTSANSTDIEPNNSTITAQLLPLDAAPITGFISSNDDLDYYKIVLPKAGKININMISKIEEVNAQLKSSNDDLIGEYLDYESKTPGSWIESFDLEAGTYYLKIERSYEDYTGTYTVNVNYTIANNNEVEPNNTTNTAQLLALNSNPITGYISWNDDSDIYKIMLPKAGKININMISKIEEVYLQLENSNGTIIDQEYLYDASEQFPKAWNPSFDLEAGTYYLKINRSYLETTGKYTLNVNYTAANNNDIEPNNSTNNSQSLTLNSNPITGYISWNDDSDIYKIVLPKAGKINVKIISEIYRVDIDLTDSKGNLLENEILFNGSTKSPKAWNPSFDLEAGTYYLKVNRDSIEYTGRYTLGVNYTAANNNDIEPNNNTSTAQLLTLNSNPTTGYISWNDNLDVYKIVIPKTTKVFINMTSQIEDVYIELINASGNKILTDYLFDGKSSSPVALSRDISLSAGTYYLKVNREYLSATGKYTVKISTSLNVKFNSNGGTIVPNQSVAYNGKATKPANPTKSGYSFSGWYKDSTFITPFDFTNTSINSDITLYAKWVAATPSNVQASSASYNSIKISWAPVSSANGYEIYRSTSGNGTYSKVGETTSLSYTNTGLSTGTSYYYKVRSYKTSGKTRVYSNYSIVVNSKPLPAVPANIKAASTNYNSIKLDWTSVSGSNGYEIYKSTSSNGTYSKVGETTSLSYTNTGLSTGTSYYYKVRSYKTSGKTRVYSNYSIVVNSKPLPAVPVNVKAASTNYNSIKLSWASTSGANGYEIYKSTSSNGTYSKVGETTSLSYTNTGLSTGTSYYYKIRSYKTVGKTRVYSNYSSIVNSKPVLNTPTNFKSTKKNSSTINLTWNGISGASGYEVYRSNSNNGTYSLVKTLTSSSYSDAGLKSGKTYYYKVRAYKTIGSKKIYSNYTSVINSKL